MVVPLAQQPASLASAYQGSTCMAQSCKNCQQTSEVPNQSVYEAVCRQPGHTKQHCMHSMAVMDSCDATVKRHAHACSEHHCDRCTVLRFTRIRTRSADTPTCMSQFELADDLSLAAAAVATDYGSRAESGC